jgi:hypothetical protein
MALSEQQMQQFLAAQQAAQREQVLVSKREDVTGEGMDLSCSCEDFL